MSVSDQRVFETAAAEYKPSSLPRELLGFLGHTKKWWLFPLLVAILLVGLMLFLSGSAAAPFLYTLF
jgi:hypothetical protein